MSKARCDLKSLSKEDWALAIAMAGLGDDDLTHAQKVQKANFTAKRMEAKARQIKGAKLKKR